MAALFFVTNPVLMIEFLVLVLIKELLKDFPECLKYLKFDLIPQWARVKIDALKKRPVQLDSREDNCQFKTQFSKASQQVDLEEMDNHQRSSSYNEVRIDPNVQVKQYFDRYPTINFNNSQPTAYAQSKPYLEDNSDDDN